MAQPPINPIINSDMLTDDLLEMRNISKSFPGVKALDQTNFSVRRGEIHGLVGENGAGKSTIIKVLAGVYERDAGDVIVNGQALTVLTPATVHAAGVRFIHQELHLVPHFTVTESVFMGQEISGAVGVRRAAMRKKAETFLKESLNCDLSGKTLIRDLGVAERKLVQIARALIDEQAKLVVFDEPTAPLASGESEQVFKAIRRLQERGITIVYVSHYLAEITALCARVTVFRNGVDVAVLDHIAEDSTEVIVKSMLGRELDALYPDKNHVIGNTFFSVSALTDGTRFNPLDLSLQHGEILGIAGLIGSGREELIDTLYGLRRPVAGSVNLDGRALALKSPADAVAAGIVLVPRDRRHDGLVLDMSVADNINLASLHDVSAAFIENRSRANQRACDISTKLDIRPDNVKAISRLLSGGNQQKVVLARWLTTQFKLLMLDEPTIGVDIGAKVEIYQLIENLARDGAGVIVSSSDPGELLGLCDRIAVMHRGVLIDVLAGNQLRMDVLVSLTTAGQVAAVAG